MIETVHGKAFFLTASDIDTDRILPARYLKLLSFGDLGAHVFEDDRRTTAKAGGVHPFDAPENQGASILIVGRNFGSGSSREHAPRALSNWGIRCVLGLGFGEIFVDNCLSVGLPCAEISDATLDWLDAQAKAAGQLELTVDIRALQVKSGPDAQPIEMKSANRNALLSGEWNITKVMQKNRDRVEAMIARRGATPTIPAIIDQSAT